MGLQISLTRIGIIGLKTKFIALIILFNAVYSQDCLLDGKTMFAVGQSEIIQNELLSLYRCDDGHQMWLTNFDDNIIELSIVKDNDIDTKLSDQAVSLFVSNEKSIKEKLIKTEPIKIIKTETVLKKISNNNNYSNSVNIQKFGIETLLHKKIESNRLFEESLEDEKSELVHLMSIHKKLFERPSKNKFSLSGIRLFEKPITIAIYSLAILAIYTLI